MTLKRLLVLSMSMSMIVVINIFGLLFIFNSVSAVKQNANGQTAQISVQVDAIAQLEAQAASVGPAVATMNAAAALESQLAAVQFAYADAGLTLSPDKLDAANSAYDALMPKIETRMIETGATADQQKQLAEAVEYARIYGNRIYQSFENNSTSMGASMTNGLREQIVIIAGMLQVISAASVDEVNQAVARVNSETEQVSRSADEVRSLAGRTQTSTVEIRQTIENLQKRTGEVVNAMEQAISTSGESVSQAQAANEAIQEISDAMSTIMNLTQLITTSAKEQSLAVDEISGQVIALSDSSVEIAELSTENQAGGKRMAEQSERLTEVVSIFKI